MHDPIFEEVRTLSDKDPSEAAERLIGWLIEKGQFHQAFDVSLVSIRLRLGLPVVWTGRLEDLDDEQRTAVEEGYLEACREIGFRLLDAGHPRDAWFYLRHLTDRQATAERIASFTPDDESREEYVEVAVHEGVAPAGGFKQVLKHFGICNAITLYDSTMYNQPREQRLAVAPLLIADLHSQLLTNLWSEIQQQEGKPPEDSSVAELIADRDWLFGEHAYHIDTSHLNAVVRFAREVDDHDVLRLALDLCEYGQRLDRQFQYAAEEPFSDTYAAHAIFFRGLVSTEQTDWNAARDYFQAKAESLPYAEHGAGPAEVFIAFLARTGHESEALEATRKFLPAGAMTSGFAPSAAELASASGDYPQLTELGAERDDIVAFATGVLAEAQRRHESSK